MDTGTTSQRPITLDGLGPLSNPSVFRVYASLYLAAVISVWAFALITGHWLWFGATVFSFGLFSFRFEDLRTRLPRAARVDGLACSLAWLWSVAFLTIWQVVVHDVGAEDLVQIPGAAALAAGGGYLSIGFGGLNLIRRLRGSARPGQG